MKHRIIILLIASLALVHCKPNEVRHDKVVQTAEPEQKVVKPFANAVLMCGSSAGNLYQTYYRLGNFNDLLLFTSQLVFKKYTRAEVLNYYKHRFKFDFVLGPLTNIGSAGDTILLTYSKAQIYGTRRKIVIPCRLENDTVKLILYNLGKQPFQIND